MPEIRTYLYLKEKGVLQEARKLRKVKPVKGGTLGRIARVFRIIKDEE
jgi:hypothetical protein